MSEDRTPRTISLTELNDEGIEESKSRPRRRKRDARAKDVRLDGVATEKREPVQEIDSSDGAWLTIR